MKTKLLSATLLALILLNISNLFSQTIIKTSFYSQALEENKNVNVFLPSCYDSETSSYPVIYYLHGWYGNENSAQLVMQLADSYINNGTIEPVIIVCANNLSQPFLGSFYKNSESNGKYEDYMTQDLIQWVESNYRVKSGKNNRSLMGQSMGGYGSFRLAVLYKNLYRGIAAHGSALNFDLVIDDIQQEIKNENGPGPDYFYNFATTGLFTKMIFAMSGAFSPNCESSQDYIYPAIVDFPFDEQGNVIDSVYQKFHSNDPVSFINTLLPSDSVAILFGAGRNDELHLFQSNFSFQDTLDNYGIDYEYVDHYGTHTMPALFRQRGLIFLDSVMNAIPEIENCEAPTNLFAVSNSDSSAQLSWIENGTATSWQIMLMVSGTDTSNVTPISVSTNPYIITGLSVNTTYEWYVRANCGDGNYSNWAGPHSFTTVNLNTAQPIGHWALDGTSGTTAFDGSGNNLHGVLVNGTQWNANGKIGSAVSCDGINDYVEIPDNDLLDPGSNDFTVSLWVYKRVRSSSWDNIWGVNKWNTGAAPGTNEWILGLGAGGNTDRPSFGIQSGTTSYGVSSDEDISLNEWHLITGVRESGQIKLYVDGVLKGTKVVGDVSVNNVGRNIRIANSQMNNYYTDGMFDDLRIYDIALSASEILALTQVEPSVNEIVQQNIDINVEDHVLEQKTSELSFQNYSHLKVKDDNISVYTFDDNLFIKSSDEALNEYKEVYIYDFYGRLESKKTIPPESLVKIHLGNCGCYKIIKVLINNRVSTHKVFIK